MLNIKTGPLLAAAFFDDEDFQSLFIAVHHLVIDLVSWRVLFQELEELLTTGVLSTAPSESFERWCSMQSQHAAENLDPGSSLPFEIQPPLLSYWGVSGSENVMGATVSKQLASTCPPARQS